MINVIKGNIYAEVDGQAAQLQSGATLYIPQGSSYMITASSETKLLKHSSVTDEMCQQVAMLNQLYLLYINTIECYKQNFNSFLYTHH